MRQEKGLGYDGCLVGRLRNDDIVNDIVIK